MWYLPSQNNAPLMSFQRPSGGRKWYFSLNLSPTNFSRNS